MKKYIVSAILSLVLVSSSVYGSFTTSIVVQPATFTNLLTLVYNGSVNVSKIIVTSQSTTNCSALIYDTGTNTFTYVNSAYSNRLAYATNYIYSTTNYYGVVNSLTNTYLVTITNSVVASTTNNYANIGVSSTAGTATAYTGNFYFDHGIWATNTSSGPLSITLIYNE